MKEINGDAECKNCAYWADGICTRYAPRPSDRTDLADGEYRPAYPATSPFELCGEHPDFWLEE